MPHSACGFLFRYQDEGNFYSLLVSNRGLFPPRSSSSTAARGRWSPGPNSPARRKLGAGRHGSAGHRFSLRVIARGGHFTDRDTTSGSAEAADESFNRGHIAFAAQNYGEGGSAELVASRFELLSAMVDSRPLELETWYYRWNYYIVPDAGARRRLAETLFAMGESLAAAVQIRKIERRRPLDADEFFLKAETALRLGLQDEAEAALDACLALDPGDRRRRGKGQPPLPARPLPRAADELATLLPRRARQRPPPVPLRPRPLRPRGLRRGAAAEYRAAADLDLRSGGGAGQRALPHERGEGLGPGRQKAEAAEAYLAAARLFSDQEADDDLALALSALSRAQGRKTPRSRRSRRKALYRAGKKDAAARSWPSSSHEGARTREAHYTLGLILAERGKAKSARALRGGPRARARLPASTPSATPSGSS